MNKGFTLVELLAVLTILTILALITTPLILDVINDTRKKSIKVSVEHYIDAIETEIAAKNVNSEYETLDGIYTISNNGKTLNHDEQNNLVLNLIYDGKGLESGSVVVENGLVRQIIDGKVDKWYAKIESQKVILLDKITNNTLLKGTEFNASIKNLVTDSEVTYESVDTIITSIEFYAYGILPSKYTIETLESLSSVDVSLNQDKSIIAYYDNNGKIYVYSDYNIMANGSTSYMFAYLNNLTNINLNALDTSNTTNMMAMFRACKNLESIDLSNFNTEKSRNMNKMFYDCYKISELDLSNFKTQYVQVMSEMFANCKTLTHLNVSSFNTSSVNNMAHMFYNCNNLEELYINNFDTNKVTNMLSMFQSCTKLTTLDLSNWNTKQVTTMEDMFLNASNLVCIQVGDNWQVAATSDDMFLYAGTNTTQTDSCEVTSS